MTSPPLTESQMMDRVESRFGLKKGWATFRGVRNHRGFDPPKGESTRTLDGMAVGVWQSLKGEVLGFECKTTRSDFLREMEDTKKSDSFYPHCNRFWLVVGAASVASPDEIPMGWGLLVPRGDGLVEKVRAKRKKTDGLTPGIMLSLLKSSADASEARVKSACSEVRATMLQQAEDDGLFNVKVRELETRVASLERDLAWTLQREKHALQRAESLRVTLESMEANPGLDAERIKSIERLDRVLQTWSSDGMRVVQFKDFLRQMQGARKTVEMMLDALTEESAFPGRA